MQVTHPILLPNTKASNWLDCLTKQIKDHRNSNICLECHSWHLTCKEFQQIKRLFEGYKVTIKLITSDVPESVISALNIGLNAQLNFNQNQKDEQWQDNKENDKQLPEIFIHQGTLRSGEIMEADEDILIIGDVNPGAKVSSRGNVMIWGRLLGIAHAGKDGDIRAKITALQLRPLQLRIANKIARGPKDKPELGLAEEARVENEEIVIKPAKTN